jgi:hypothetical protein
METKAISRIKPSSSNPKRGNCFRRFFPLVATACILASGPSFSISNPVLGNPCRDYIKTSDRIQQEFNIIKIASLATVSSGLALAGLILYLLKSQNPKQ